MGVVDGNRHYNDALLEMADIATLGGFTTIAAGAFIAAHTFDSPAHPIASGRPDAGDLAMARSFGATIAVKLRRTTVINDIDRIAVPRNRPYRGYGHIPVTPVCISVCNQCGVCVTLCSAAAIQRRDDRLITASSACIRCHACVKACPRNTRNFNDQNCLRPITV